MVTMEDRLLANIFTPYSMARRASMREKNARFVHYTSADNGIKIIRGGEFWFRNSLCMNDYMEIEHGFGGILHFMEENRNIVKSALDNLYDGLFEESFGLYDKNFYSLKTQSYIACMSEHDDSEDMYGRLSMWRAYGGGANGIAIVLNGSPFLSEEEGKLKIFSTPVMYLNKNEISDLMFNFISTVNNNSKILVSVDREKLKNWIYFALTIISISSKHPGFQEEREWRSVYCPTIYGSDGVLGSIESINGVPQKVYKVKINEIQIGDSLLEISSFIDRIIVGPSRFSEPIRHAFVEELEKAGVKNSLSKVVVSDIPLRV